MFSALESIGFRVWVRFCATRTVALTHNSLLSCLQVGELSKFDRLTSAMTPISVPFWLST